MVPYHKILGGTREKLTRMNWIEELAGEVVERALKGSKWYWWLHEVSTA